ncbi:primosomal protein N' [Bogoriella caseilytica]|uniref:Probable replication restart protein PriA n=1 Tax=Bogoriella caseilytica TaxID=56055 RepID=A0A3N2B8S7_9MICO|nr:primosomal protein N' [Bogoriella caseilytica]ROR71689.1 replication restart DNA helicase PriA [Bogoriella caseilytica]
MNPGAAYGEQGSLLEVPVVARTVRSPGVTDPVARVLVDGPLPHLDRPFDYLVRAEHADNAVVGSRVHVRFAGQDRQGFVCERRSTTEHPGELAPLRRAASPLPVLSPEVLQLCRAVAERYAGTLSDVLRLAVPPRHATTEKSVLEKDLGEPPALPEATDAPEGSAWAPYRAGPAFLEHLAIGESPRAAWSALPGPWQPAVAQAVRAVRASGRGALVVLPTTRDVDAVLAAIAEELPQEPVARLVADDGQARRYRAFLRVLLGQAQVVVGTRAAAFAPVQDLGLVAVIDDGDDALAEPRAPYPHARQVLLLRAEQSGAAVLIGGWSRTVEAHLLVERGWAQPLEAARELVRERAPRIEAPTELDLAREGPAAAARIPHPAWELAKRALQGAPVRGGPPVTPGPVLVQVPRSGYVPAVACAGCREPARCAQCHGPVGLGRAGSTPACQWCAHLAANWSCPECGASRLRSVRIGSDRTAEELGRAFPQVPVIVSGAKASHGIVETVDDKPRIVVATPGAEPVAEGGFAAALLLDASVMTTRPELWASSVAMQRWMAAAALVRSASAGGRVMLLGRPAPGPAQALVRWDPAGFAARELAERTELRFPPAARLAAVDGTRESVHSILGLIGEVPGLDVLGPVERSEAVPEQAEPARWRALVRTPLRHGGELTAALRRAAAVRSARKEPGSLRIQVDPADLW